MLEHLYPCGHCGERPRIGRSQRLIDCEENRLYDYSTFGRYAGRLRSVMCCRDRPKPQDRKARLHLLHRLRHANALGAR